MASGAWGSNAKEQKRNAMGERVGLARAGASDDKAVASIASRRHDAVLDGTPLRWMRPREVKNYDDTCRTTIFRTSSIMFRPATADMARAGHRLQVEDRLFIRKTVPEELQAFPDLDLPGKCRLAVAGFCCAFRTSTEGMPCVDCSQSHFCCRR